MSLYRSTYRAIGKNSYSSKICQKNLSCKTQKTQDVLGSLSLYLAFLGWVSISPIQGKVLPWKDGLEGFFLHKSEVGALNDRHENLPKK